MGQYFLASVGNVEAFRKQDGKLVHFFSAKSLTDSSIALDISSEEVRGGMGGQLLGQFFHTSNFNFSMTDVSFKLEYIAAQVGGHIDQGGYTLATEQKRNYYDFSRHEAFINLDHVPMEILHGSGLTVWYKAIGDDEYKIATATLEPGGKASFAFPAPSFDVREYCVRYFAKRDDARKLVISSGFIPQELTIMLTTRLYTGDPNNPESGKPVGSVTVQIPRFQLNGTMDINMAMSSAATLQLEGKALCFENDCNGGKYAEIVEFVKNSRYAGYTGLRADATYTTIGDEPMVYLAGPTRIPRLVENSEIEFNPPLVDGKIPGVLEIEMTFIPDRTIRGVFNTALVEEYEVYAVATDVDGEYENILTLDGEAFNVLDWLR